MDPIIDPATDARCFQIMVAMRDGARMHRLPRVDARRKGDSKVI